MTLLGQEGRQLGAGRKALHSGQQIPITQAGVHSSPQLGSLCGRKAECADFSCPSATPILHPLVTSVRTHGRAKIRAISS